MRSQLLLAALFLALPACAPSPAPAPAAQSSALEGAFTSASREYQVPVELLKGIAWVETRVSPTSSLESASGGLGLMQLVERDDWTLQSRAMALTGVTHGQLAVDPAANLRGAAAVLRELFDQTARDEAGLDPRQAGDWYRALALYPGFDGADAANDWASDVFRAIAKGFSAPQTDGVVTQAPTWTSWARHAPATQARRDALGDYPGRAAYVQSPNKSSGRTSYEFIVIHTMQGSYAGSRSWFLNTSSQVSSHYIVRSSDGEITQMVEHADTAWHAQCYNARSIGIEHEGFVQDPTRWYTDAMYTESAKLTRYIADRHGIPRTRQRIIGHAEVAPNCNTGGHTDPGSGWNWTRYMALVNGAGPTPSTGTLIGVIFQNGSSTNRVAGAVVTAGGQTATTGADGIYQLTLPAGAVTATVTKAGYGSNSVARAVTTGAQTWGSMEINPTAPQTGTLSGTVFSFNSTNPGDTSAVLAGASVSVAGQTVTTPASGAYSFTLPAGTHTVTVIKTGYQQAQVSRTVTAGQTVSGPVGLTPTAMSDLQAPQLMFINPSAGAELDLAVVLVKGTASDDRGAVASVRLSLNGGAEQTVPVTAGSFQVEVTLRPGANTLLAKAVDAAGNEGSTSTTATFTAGLVGTVTRAGDGLVPIEGAVVELRAVGSGAVVSSSTTDAAGRYVATVTNVPSDFILVARAAGHLTASETVSVPADRRLTHDLVLTPGQDTQGEATLRFAEPLDGAEVMTDSVTVYGQVTGFDLVGVTVNGAAAELVGAGGFSASVPLVKGTNSIEAIATGVAGQTVSGRLNVSWRGQQSNAQAETVVGGCTLAPSAPVIVLALVLASRRARRRSLSLRRS